MNLNQIGVKYGTDKSTIGHGYLDVYEKHLPKYPKTMLELGIEVGESALMWREYFPKTELWFLDLFENKDFVSEDWCKSRGFIPFKSNQQDVTRLKELTKQFDIIIDDCSHVPGITLISFKQLFFNNLKSGGIFVVEDLQTNLISNKWFWGSYTKSFEDTFLYMILEYLYSKKIINPYFTPEESEQLESMIESCDLYQGKIVFIKKK